MRPLTTIVMGTALACAWLAAPVGARSQDQPQRWYKGNTHTHTVNSDGDSTPDEVVRWYRERDYHFVVLSDHNFLTSVDGAQVRNNRLFEVYNGHPQVNIQGGGGIPGLEEVWDAILSSGVLIYGIAVDDAHIFKRPWDRTVARPGRGWIMVRAARLSARDILEAVEQGEFYASTGVVLEDYRVTEQSMTVIIAEDPWSKYRVQFIGEGGRILAETIANPAVYEFSGEEPYVRAKVLESNGLVAWLQPAWRAEPDTPRPQDP